MPSRHLRRHPVSGSTRMGGSGHHGTRACRLPASIAMPGGAGSADDPDAIDAPGPCAATDALAVTIAARIDSDATKAPRRMATSLPHGPPQTAYPCRPRPRGETPEARDLAIPVVRRPTMWFPLVAGGASGGPSHASPPPTPVRYPSMGSWAGRTVGERQEQRRRHRVPVVHARGDCLTPIRAGSSGEVGLLPPRACRASLGCMADRIRHRHGGSSSDQRSRASADTTRRHARTVWAATA